MKLGRLRFPAEDEGGSESESEGGGPQQQGRGAGQLDGGQSLQRVGSRGCGGVRLPTAVAPSPLDARLYPNPL